MFIINWPKFSWALLANVCATVVFALAVTSSSMAAQFLPFDQATKDESLVNFRAQLIEAVDQRDFQRLRAFLSPDIQLSFGGHSGIVQARKFFRDDPTLWGQLARVLANGGGFEINRETGAEMFIAPYTFFAEAPAGRDVFEYVILTGENVEVHAQPSTGSPVVGRYGYEVLPADAAGESDESWQAVALPNGQTGYVEQKYLATGVDYRAGFEKSDGQWKVIFFLAGD